MHELQIPDRYRRDITETEFLALYNHVHGHSLKKVSSVGFKVPLEGVYRIGIELWGLSETQITEHIENLTASGIKHNKTQSSLREILHNRYTKHDLYDLESNYYGLIGFWANRTVQ